MFNTELKQNLADEIAKSEDRLKRAQSIYAEQKALNPEVLGTSGKIARDGIINVLETVFGDEL